MFDTKTRVKSRVNWLKKLKDEIDPNQPVALTESDYDEDDEEFEEEDIIEDCDLAFSIMETPFKRDIVKELCDAGRKHGIMIDLYYSHPDWFAGRACRKLFKPYR